MIMKISCMDFTIYLVKFWYYELQEWNRIVMFKSWKGLFTMKSFSAQGLKPWNQIEYQWYYM